ncbi:MAG: hypothetical protein Q4F83_03655 [Eubacteriales bacterium]|nr:hypothetical protein [Eubacteriales bacterium]
MKKNFALVMFLLTISLTGTAGFASEQKPAEVVQEQRDDGAQTRIADTIETKYRENNGYLEYRRWNCTKGCWVDPYWIRLA